MINDKWHLNKQNRTTRLPQRLFFVDTETKEKKLSKKEKSQTLRLGVAAKWLRCIDKEGKDLSWIIFDTPKAFWEWLDEEIKDKTKVYLFAHNWKFDYRVLDGDKHLLNLGWDLENPIRGGNIWLDFWNKEKKTLVVTDTFNIFRHSVREIGKSLGLPKLNVKPLKAKQPELIEYCKRDVEIIYEAIRRLISWLNIEDLGGFAPTVGGIAYNVYTHAFQQQPYLVHKHRKSIDLELEAYRGGWTDCFYIGDTENDEVYKLDVNSMYPSVMQRHEYPLIWVEHNGWKDLDELKAAMKEYSVVAKVGIELYKRRIGIKRGRLIFPIGKFEAVLTTPELQYVMKYGKLHYVKEFVCYEKSEPFTDFVDYFWSMRRKAKEENDETATMLLKLIMNNLYGKIAEQEYLTEYVGEAGPEIEDYQIAEDDMEERTTRNCYKFGDKLWITSRGDIKEQSLVAIPAHVTAYARLKLAEFIERAKEENVYYIDTDSLFVNREGYKNLSSEIDDKALGKLKVEGIDRLIVRNVKDYQFGKENKTKGIKKNAKLIGKNKYEQELPEGYLTAVKKQRTDEVRIQIKPKTMQRIYKKGYGKIGQRTKPFVLSDF